MLGYKWTSVCQSYVVLKYRSLSSFLSMGKRHRDLFQTQVPTGVSVQWNPPAAEMNGVQYCAKYIFAIRLEDIIQNIVGQLKCIETSASRNSFNDLTTSLF